MLTQFGKEIRMIGAIAGIGLGFGLDVALAQPVQQVVKPPVAQAWIDIATISGFGIPGLGGMSGEDGVDGALGAILGRQLGARDNAFGRTGSGEAGRWVDVTLYTRRNPKLSEATQSVPTGTRLAPTLKLQVLPQAKEVARDELEDPEVPPQFERPKGKILFYWGCGETVRPGQPRVLDIAKASPEDLAAFFQVRRATRRGAHSAAGRPVWPSRDDRRLVPDGSSFVGEHAFSGEGVPENFRFTIPAAQDIMPEIELTQRDAGKTIELTWKAIPHARAYFLSAIGSKGEDEMEIVIWASSEVPETGFGLFDYQTNTAVDRWLKEKVLLPPTVTRCVVPKAIFGEEGGGMLKMIAYGTELNLAHPPRPDDPKIPWEPEWAVKIRVKSQTSAIVGMNQ